MPLRTVVMSHEAQNVLDSEATIHPRLAEIYRGLEWRLCRDPKSGYKKDADNWIIRVNGDAAARVPTIVLLYRFDENEVEILRMLIKVPSPVRLRIAGTGGD